MSVAELIAELLAKVAETGDPDAEVLFDRHDVNNVPALPKADGDTWAVRGLEYVGGPPFEDGVIYLHA